MLQDVHVTREEATALFKQLIVIDFPPVVDVRQNRHSRELLFRDLENVYRYFSRFGVEASPRRITDGLWHKFMRGML